MWRSFSGRPIEWENKTSALVFAVFASVLTGSELDVLILASSMVRCHHWRVPIRDPSTLPPHRNQLAQCGQRWEVMLGRAWMKKWRKTYDLQILHRLLFRCVSLISPKSSTVFCSSEKDVIKRCRQLHGLSQHLHHHFWRSLPKTEESQKFWQSFYFIDGRLVFWASRNIFKIFTFCCCCFHRLHCVSSKSPVLIWCLSLQCWSQTV